MTETNFDTEVANFEAEIEKLNLRLGVVRSVSETAKTKALQAKAHN